MNHNFQMECRGTRHFYSLVKILNKQIGPGKWTTQGRPVRRLRRLDLANWFARANVSNVSFAGHTATVVFKVPEDHSDIESVLNLWGDTDGPR
jgi:hypothetical protein